MPPTLPPWYPQDAYKASVEHWQMVRAGLAQAEPHTFGPDVESSIEACQFNAREHIEAAARWMRRAEALHERTGSWLTGKER